MQGGINTSTGLINPLGKSLDMLSFEFAMPIKSSNGFANTPLSHSPIPMLANIDGSQSPSCFLSLSSAADQDAPQEIQITNLVAMQVQQQQQYVQVDTTSTSSPVPSYHSSSSVNSSPIQDHYYSPSSPTTSSPNQQSSEISSPNQQSDYNMVYNFVQQNSPTSDMVPLSSPFRVQPVVIQTSASSNDNELQEMLNKPFSKESFMKQMRSIIPTYNESEFSEENQMSYDSSSSSQESDFEQQQSNNRKRGREEEIDTSGFTVLSKDQVLKLSSKEIEEYVGRLKLNHVLTPAEEKELKKQRRLIKNREYASQSRSRRKVYVENIEQKLQKNNQETTSIKQQLTNMKEENKILKKQLFTLTQTLKSNPSIAEAFGKIFSPLGSADSKKAAATISLFVFFSLFTLTFLFPIQPNFSIISSTGTRQFGPRNLLWDNNNQQPDSFFEQTKILKDQIILETKEFIEKMLAELKISAKDKKSCMSSFVNELMNPTSPSQKEFSILAMKPVQTQTRQQQQPLKKSKRVASPIQAEFELNSSPLNCSSPLSSSDYDN
eukprot:gene2643-3048_t